MGTLGEPPLRGMGAWRGCGTFRPFSGLSTGLPVHATDGEGQLVFPIRRMRDATLQGDLCVTTPRCARSPSAAVAMRGAAISAWSGAPRPMVSAPIASGPRAGANVAKVPVVPRRSEAASTHSAPAPAEPAPALAPGRAVPWRSSRSLSVGCPGLGVVVEGEVRLCTGRLGCVGFLGFRGVSWPGVVRVSPSGTGVNGCRW